MSTSSLDTAAWLDRLRPAFRESMDRVTEAITNEPGIQDWLRTASLEAAMGLEMQADMQAAAMAYGEMLTDLEQRFPDLKEAVHILTDGCGELALHWRPLSPQFSTVYVDFTLPFRPRLFILAETAAPEQATHAMQRLAEALPKGTPFIGHPNEVTGAVGRDGRVIGVRLQEAQTREGQLVRSVSLYPRGGEPVANLTEAQAEAALSDLLPHPPHTD